MSELLKTEAELRLGCKLLHSVSAQTRKPISLLQMPYLCLLVGEHRGENLSYFLLLRVCLGYSALIPHESVIDLDRFLDFLFKFGYSALLVFGLLFPFAL